MDERMDLIRYFETLVQAAQAGDAEAIAELDTMQGRQQGAAWEDAAHQARMRYERARGYAELRARERDWWRNAALILLLILLTVALLLQPARAEEPAPAPVVNDIQASCWRFDVIGQRRLVWSATGSAAHWIQRDGQDVLRVEQTRRQWAQGPHVVEHVVADGEACVVGPRVTR